MFKGQHHESRKSLSLLTLEHAYCKKSQLLRGTFCFTQVQGPNALTTLLHLADEFTWYLRKLTFLIPSPLAWLGGEWEIKTHPRSPITNLSIPKTLNAMTVEDPPGVGGGAVPFWRRRVCKGQETPFFSIAGTHRPHIFLQLHELTPKDPYFCI